MLVLKFTEDYNHLRLEYWTEDVFHRKMGPYLFESHQRDIFGKFLSLFG